MAPRASSATVWNGVELLIGYAGHSCYSCGRWTNATILGRRKVTGVRERTGQHVQAGVRSEVEHAIQVELLWTRL